jgi:hypothetical protein
MFSKLWIKLGLIVFIVNAAAFESGSVIPYIWFIRS